MTSNSILKQCCYHFHFQKLISVLVSILQQKNSFIFLKVFKNVRCAIAEWYGAGLAIARSRVQIPPTATVCQRQLSVPSLRGRLMSTSKSWGVNGHTTWCTSPVSVVLRLRLVSGWGLWNGDQHHPMGLKARERTLLFTFFTFKNVHKSFKFFSENLNENTAMLLTYKL